MKVTAWMSIALALGILASQAATADPEARNHGVGKSQESQKDRVQQRVKPVDQTEKKIRDPGVNARQEQQKDRIVQGVASGELTRQEATELAQERRDIKQLEQTYKADGALTTKERKDLHQQLNQAGDEIREEKHDQQQRQ
jgi:hypothetical protein